MSEDMGGAAFRQLLFGDSALQARLGAIEDPAEFERQADALAVGRGVSPFAAAPARLDQWPPIGWLPIRRARGERDLAFEWAWFGDHSLRDPFFDDSVRRMAGRPMSRHVRPTTDLTALVAGATQEATLSPDGFIFHMSRCGSTLAAQMLAAPDHHVVISEAPPIDDIVQWSVAAGSVTDAHIAALRAMVAALGRNRSGTSRRYFVKLDSWHILALPLFRAAFPATSWVFLYREPEAVMVSHLGMPGMHFATGMVPSLSSIGEARQYSFEDRGAAVLAAILDAAAQHANAGTGGMLVNYRNLRAAMIDSIPHHFSFCPDVAEHAAMDTAANRDAKAPAQVFTDDSVDKRRAVTPAIAAAVARHLAEPYARLEALRIGAGGA